MTPAAVACTKRGEIAGDCGFGDDASTERIHQIPRFGQNARGQGSLCLIDCKRGDLGPSLVAYADAFLGPDSPFFADAITVAPYLGFDSLTPVLDKAVSVGAGIFVVVRSSSPEGRTLQDARLSDGRSVADSLADEITRFNSLQGKGLGPIGAVMGATLDERGAQTLARLPHSLFLAPGLGAQGGTFSTMARNFGASAGRAIPSVSREILAQGPSVAKLREVIRRNQEAARTTLLAPL